MLWGKVPWVQEVKDNFALGATFNTDDGDPHGRKDIREAVAEPGGQLERLL